MEKRVGTLGLVALCLLGYLIWKDPSGMSDLVVNFANAVGGFISELWDRLGEFASGLADG